MHRIVVIAACILCIPTSQAQAAIVFQPIEGLASTYVPGVPVIFEVRLPAIDNLGAYDIEIVLEGAGAAGLDFSLDATATSPAPANYVFPTAQNYSDLAAIAGISRSRITLTDFSFTGSDVVRGLNDRVATVSFSTSPGYHGPLSVFVNAASLILDTPDIAPTPVLNFDEIQAAIAAAAVHQLTAVPEPSSLLLVAASSAIALLGKGTRRRQPLSQKPAQLSPP